MLLPGCVQFASVSFNARAVGIRHSKQPLEADTQRHTHTHASHTLMCVCVCTCVCVCGLCGAVFVCVCVNTKLNRGTHVQRNKATKVSLLLLGK